MQPVKIEQPAKTEKVYVKGPFFPGNTFIVLRKITNGDIVSEVRVVTRPNKVLAVEFARKLAKNRNIPIGGFLSADLMEIEPR